MCLKEYLAGMCLKEYLAGFEGRKVRVYYSEVPSHSGWPNPYEGRLAVVGDDFISVDTGNGFEIFFPFSAIIIVWVVDE